MSERPEDTQKPTPSLDDTDVQGRVVDFNEVRTKRLEEKRRKTERILFQSLLGVYCVLDQSDMRGIEIVDMSEEGLAFQVAFNPRSDWKQAVGDLVPLRLYFSQETYLALQVKITNVKPSIESGMRYTRYGCLVDPTMASFEAFQRFVKFLKAYSEQAHRDTGKASVFYL
jgi:hypothetical protein